MELARNLRYSPVNWLIVDWGFNGQAFANCALPQPQPCAEPKTPAPAECCPLPIQEAIDTYDWERWLPEVIVGVEDPDEEIAASYVREAAIEFCKSGRVLQREVVVPLQPHVSVYPVFPYPEEQIIGVIGVGVAGCQPCHCSSTSGMLPNGTPFVFDVARNELHIDIRHHGWSGFCRKNSLLRVLVWSAPTEDACVHDKFLYERFRSDITLGARRRYCNAVHFRDRLLMASLPSAEAFNTAVALAKTKAMSKPSFTRAQPGSGMWQTANCCGRGWQ